MKALLDIEIVGKISLRQKRFAENKKQEGKKCFQQISFSRLVKAFNKIKLSLSKCVNWFCVWLRASLAKVDFPAVEFSIMIKVNFIISQLPMVSGRELEN